MLSKIKWFISENRNYHKEQINLLKELNWANVYHDSIRGEDSLKNLPLNIGRWAGNYTFFYILYRVIKETQPKAILELGLGESTKFITSLIDVYKIKHHDVVEHDQEWINIYKSKELNSSVTKFFHKNLVETDYNNTPHFSYSDLDGVNLKSYDLYVIDGPFGSKFDSRKEIIDLIMLRDNSKDFVIIIDDSDRVGEKLTIKNLENYFIKESIGFKSTHYHGLKSVYLCCSLNYKFLTSL